MNRKLYVYMIICFISLSILTTTKAEAATANPSFSVSPNGIVYAYLEESYIVDYEAAGQQVDAYGNYNIYTYAFDLAPSIGLTGDGFYTGSGIYQIDFTPTVPNGLTLRFYDKEYTPVFTNEFMSTAYTYSGSLTNSMQIRFYCADAWSNGWTGLGNIHIRFTMVEQVSGSNPGTPPQNILVSVSSQTKTSSYNIHPYITDEEGSLYHVIRSAVDGSQTSQDIVALVQTLEYIKTQDLNSYSNILQTLSEIEEWDGIFNDWLTAISNDTSDIVVDLSTIISFLQNYMPYMRSINSNILLIYQALLQMNAEEQSEAAAMSQEYANIASQADNMGSGMNPPKPNISSTQFDITNNVNSVQLSTFGGLVGMILGNSFITKMLLIVFTGALIGFVLYGRKH